MDKLIMAKVKYYVEQIKKVTGLRKDLEICRNVMPEKVDIYLDADTIYLSWSALSMDEVKSTLNLFAKQGIMLDKKGGSEDRPTWYLNGKAGRILLTPYWNYEKVEGATCRLIQVGEETHTYPKYKLVCEGGNDE